MRLAVLSLVLIQVIVSITLGHPCPKRCSCKIIGPQAEWLKAKCEDGILDIGDVGIGAVSVELFQLDLSKNEIFIIEPNVFKNFTNLKRLDLSANKINSLVEGCFVGLENLERLNLSNNHISAIDVFTFRQLPNLKRLDLSSNKLTALEATLFHDLLTLDRLKLRNNSLSTLADGTFQGLKSLKQLDVSNNPWKCDCDLYWFYIWMRNATIKLNPPPECDSPANLHGQQIKKLLTTEDLQCQWMMPAIEIRPGQDQVVFAGDSITLRCRAPGVTEDKNAKLSWLWYPNVTTEVLDVNAYKDPKDHFPSITIENRDISSSGIVDSSLSIIPVKKEHNGQWNCLLASVHGNRSKAISMIVISEDTRYCPLEVTQSNKGIYAWPKTIVGWTVELPCKENRLTGLMQLPLLASYKCNATGHWENLNTEVCPFDSPTTRVLEQFSKLNLSSTKGNLLETARTFRNHTGESVRLTDPVEVNFITKTIENYLEYLVEEKELGGILVDVVSSLVNLPKDMLVDAEVSYHSCRKLVKCVETIVEFTPSIQVHKDNLALEEFRVRKDSYVGLICIWYSSTSESGKKSRNLHCATNNKTATINSKDKEVEAFIQLPPTLLNNFEGSALAHQLMIAMYSDNKLFPKLPKNSDDHMDISSCVVGGRILGFEVKQLNEPVYIMLKAPLYHYAGSRPRPVIWDPDLNETGGWTTDGCRLSHLYNNLIVFQCNRLGYYGLLQDTSFFNSGRISVSGLAKFRYSNPAIYVGSGIIIVCLVFIIVTYLICFASIAMPKKAKHCAINTWIAMALLCFLYTIGIQQTENVQICQGVGLVLHYLSLSCLLWMIASASNMYKRFSKSEKINEPDDELPEEPIQKPILGLYLVGWGIALIICGISGAINLREYAGYSHCFLTRHSALAVLYVPAVILIVYLIILHLVIRCVVRNVDLNGQLSEGTQATENLDLELLEPTTNMVGDHHSTHSTRTVSSETEDPEHSQITQLKALTVVLILYLLIWGCAASSTIKPLERYLPHEETVFSVLYAVFAGCMGIFVLLFYGIARSDVRSQWLRMHCWLRRRKNRCCRARSISDANPTIPVQPFVQNPAVVPPPPMSNSQATQVTSDTNSLTSSRRTNGSHIYNPSKIIDRPIKDPQKVPNMNLVVLHRQQYRSSNSMSNSYVEPQTATSIEMFYNPHQSGVARKFFKKQRRHTKNNHHLGPRKQGDGGATSDGGSCVSVPRPQKHKLMMDNNHFQKSELNGKHHHGEKKQQQQHHSRILTTDSGSEERTAPLRFVIGQEILQDNNQAKPIVINDDEMMEEEKFSQVDYNESDLDTRTDEEKNLRNVSQQCSLEYNSAEMDCATQLTSERSDHNLPDIGESMECMEQMNHGIERCLSSGERDLLRRSPDKFLKRSYQSTSLRCLPIERHADPRRNNSYRSSLNDVASISGTSSKNCEYSRPSLNDLPSTTSFVSNAQGKSLTDINSLTSENAMPSSSGDGRSVPESLVDCISAYSEDPNEFNIFNNIIVPSDNEFNEESDKDEETFIVEDDMFCDEAACKKETSV